MQKKYIRYFDWRIYAIFYYESNTICYNLNFSGKVQIFIYKGILAKKNSSSESYVISKNNKKEKQVKMQKKIYKVP